MMIRWDSRNGLDSYPYPHNVAWGWQSCPSCQRELRRLDVKADYLPKTVQCQCGKLVHLPGIEDAGRFSGLRDIVGGPPLVPGEIPANCSDLVREEFESLFRAMLHEMAVKTAGSGA